MIKDLQNNIVENDSKLLFYGIYFGEDLIARMCLYEVKPKYDQCFMPKQDYLTLGKPEVLPNFQNNGYGKRLVCFAKSFNKPIKTNQRVNSHGRSKGKRIA